MPLGLPRPTPYGRRGQYLLRSLPTLCPQRAVPEKKNIDIVSMRTVDIQQYADSEICSSARTLDKVPY